MKKLLGIRVCFQFALLTCVTLQASAYNEAVHEVLSNNAARRSVLYTTPSLLADWGYGDPLTTTFQSYDLPFQTIESMIGKGAYREDSLNQIKRVFNHFTNAQVNPPYGLGLQGPLVGTAGHPSPLWALEDLQPVSSISVPLASPTVITQEYSLRDASEHFFRALTNSEPGIRGTEFGTVFQILGHVAHHVQDMGQPQHVRNESHISQGLIYPQGPTYDFEGSWYERYTSFKYPEGDPQERLKNLLITTQYVIPSFPTAREFWSQPAVPGPRFRGMADFTSQNYVGQATNFRVTTGSNGSVTVRAATNLPLPSGTNRNGTPMRLERINLPITMHDGTVRSTSMRYVKGDVYDEYTGQTQERILASESIFLPAFVQTGPLDATFATNSVVFDDNYPVLLPRGAAFSAGLINHFFRGRLYLNRTTPTGTNWTITNTGSQAMNGEFYIYRENSSGVRALAAGPVVTALNANATTQVAVPEPPSGTQRMVVVFRGQIGAEGSVSNGFYAVAGKVVTFSAQTISCQGTTRGTGSTEGADLTWNLGSNGGNVQAEFEAYGIPDEIIISAANAAGTVLARSNGFMSGYRLFNFNFNPQALGSTSVRLKVNAPTAGTAWNYLMKCPGETITNNDREFPRVSVTFTFGQLLSGAAFGCRAEWILNGQSQGTVQFSSTTGPATRTMTMSKGQAHQHEFRNYNCDVQASNLIPNVSYTDSVPGHKHATQRMSTTGVFDFDVH